MDFTGKECGKILPVPPTSLEASSAASLGAPSGASPEVSVFSVPIHSDDTPELGQRSFTFRSPAMRAIYGIATQVAGSDASVLISGESGTGKELLARLLHTLSGRSSRPFVPVNCGVLQGELFADKFFGHEAGAFTGANKARKGAFESAGMGTLFLDEVGEIPASNQTDFLRVLEERSFRRMGGEKDIPFQARIVAATNRSLQRMVQEGRFRADLFYRLNVVPVHLPPLRERREDISLLVEHVLAQLRHQYHRPEIRLHSEVLELFRQYAWPGNVRELRNLIERLVLLARDDMITVENLPLEMQLGSGIIASPPESQIGGVQRDDGKGVDEAGFDLATAVKEAEVRAIVKAMKHAGGHKGRSAQLLGISERSLRYKVAEYRIRFVF